MGSPSEQVHKKESRKLKRRGAFEKPDAQKQNLHNLDIGRDEVKSGDPNFDNKADEDTQKEPWKKRH